jgi:hypothetical protein
MVLIFNKFDLKRDAFGKCVDDIVAQDVQIGQNGQTSIFHRSSVILFHDLNTGNFRVLKHRHSGAEESGVINKYNKGVLLDLILGNE